MADCCAELKAELSALRQEISKLNSGNNLEARVAALESFAAQTITSLAQIKAALQDLAQKYGAILITLATVTSTLAVIQAATTALTIKVATALSLATAAQATATTAQATATAATSAAATATGLATTAKGVADTAKGIADSTRAVADTAKGVADGARGVADGARGVADTAKAGVDTLKPLTALLPVIGALLSLAGIAISLGSLLALGSRIDALENYVDSLSSGLSNILGQLGRYVRHDQLPNLRGRDGNNGTNGKPGEPGRQGDKGDRGERRLQGEKGDRGERGLQGERGLLGYKGDRGERGLQGLKGDRGDRGERGLQGATGARGEKGDRGLQGATGARGEKGDRGLQGARGEKGDRGATGIQGIQGIPGEDGQSFGGEAVEFVEVVVPVFTGLTITEGDETKATKPTFSPKYTNTTVTAIKGTESQVILNFERLAIIEAEKHKADYYVGTNDYPIKVPKVLTNPEKGTIHIHNKTRFLAYVVKQLDALCGQYPIKVEIEDADLTQSGKQKQEIILPNIAEALAEIFGLVMTIRSESDANLSATIRGLIEIGSTKQTALLAYDYAKANAEYLGYKGKQVENKIPFAFKPGEQRLDAMLKEGEISVKGWENDDKEDLNTHIAPLLEHAAMWKAQNFRNLGAADPLSKLKDLLTGGAEVAKTIDGIVKANKRPIDPNNPEKAEDWDGFLEQAEQGFIAKPGITDTTNPYSRPLKQRPKIKEIGEDTSDTDTTSGANT